MARQNVPTDDNAALVWCTNFVDVAGGSPEAFGFTTEFITRLGGLVTAFQAALARHNATETRGPASRGAKDDAKKAMLDFVRKLARVADAYPGVTDDQRRSLGLHIPDRDPTPKPAPSVAPAASATPIIGTTVKLAVRRSDSNRLGRPAGVSGAMVFSYVGTTPPADPAKWRNEGATSRREIDVVFPPDTPPGAQVWFTVCWVGAKLLTGPPCAPITTRVIGAIGSAAA